MTAKAPPITAQQHANYLDYRERHMYFARSTPRLSMSEYVASDAEFRALDARGDKRDDEEEERHQVLAKLLFRD